MSENDLINTKNPDINTFQLTGVNLESTQKFEKDSKNDENSKVSLPEIKELDPQKFTPLITKIPLSEPNLKPQTTQYSTLTIKKEQTILKNTVQFASKKEEKIEKKKDKLPSLKGPAKKSNMRASTSNSSLRTGTKIDRLKNVLDEMKQNKEKKDLKKIASAAEVRSFADVYEQKIVEYLTIQMFFL